MRAADGAALFVKLVGRRHRDADLLYKLWRFVVFREVEDEAPFATPKQQVEHEAYLSLLAQRAGVRVPSLRFAVPAGDGYVTLVQDWVTGRSLELLDPAVVDDHLLRSVWREVAKLHEAGIAHRDLRLANILVGTDGRPWLVDFGYAQAAASERHRGKDVAELLASLACIVGVRRTVAAAAGVLDPVELVAALPLLQPLALSVTTRAALRRQRGVLDELRAAVADVTGETAIEPPPLTRARAATLAILAVGALGVHAVLPQFGQVAAIVGDLATVQWPDLVLAAILTALSYATAAVALLASSPRPLGFGRTAAVQAASSYLNRLAPGGLGGVAANERYLERAGLHRHQALTAVSVMTAAIVLSHVALLLLAGVSLAAGGDRQSQLPQGWPVLAVLVLGLVALGLALRRPLGRQNVTARLRLAVAALPLVAQRPARTAVLIAATVGTTGCYVVALAVCSAASALTSRSPPSPLPTWPARHSPLPALLPEGSARSRALSLWPSPASVARWPPSSRRCWSSASSASGCRWCPGSSYFGVLSGGRCCRADCVVGLYLPPATPRGEGGEDRPYRPAPIDAHPPHA